MDEAADDMKRNVAASVAAVLCFLLNGSTMVMHLADQGEMGMGLVIGVVLLVPTALSLGSYSVAHGAAITSWLLLVIPLLTSALLLYEGYRIHVDPLL